MAIYDNNEALKAKFESLPIEVKNKIVQAGIVVNSVEELEELSRRITELY